MPWVTIDCCDWSVDQLYHYPYNEWMNEMIATEWVWGHPFIPLVPSIDSSIQSIYDELLFLWIFPNSLLLVWWHCLFKKFRLIYIQTSSRISSSSLTLSFGYFGLYWFINSIQKLNLLPFLPFLTAHIVGNVWILYIVYYISLILDAFYSWR